MPEHGVWGPCAACGGKAHLRYSKYCNNCGRRIARNGTAFAPALRLKDLDPHREAVAGALARHRKSKAVKGAYTLAAELMAWQPRYDFSVHHQLREQLQRLINFEITPAQVVQRICEFFVWEAAHPTATKLERDSKLAMAVMRLAPLMGWRPRAHVLRLLAQLINDEGLMRFAVGLSMKIEQDHNDRAQLVKDLGDFS